MRRERGIVRDVGSGSIAGGGIGTGIRTGPGVIVGTRGITLLPWGRAVPTFEV